MIKNYALLILFLLITYTAKSQTNVFPTTGNAGIGTLNPQANLDFYRYYDPNQTKMIKLFYQGSWGFVPYANAFRFLDISSTEGGKILQVNGYGLGIGGYDPPAMDSPDKLYINGNVGIGTTTPQEKLAVNGKIRAREVKVENANWPDFVFDRSYQLMTLKEVEKSIQQEGHLPGIPSAAEVKASGVELGDISAKLLQKIEELTLYLIDQNKQIKELQEQNKKLTTTLDQLKIK